MANETLSSALEREHHEIDAGIESYSASLAPADLRDTLTALRRHIYLEEEFLFPPLRDSGLLAPIFVMLREHGELWDAMARIDGLLADGKDARDACTDLLERLTAHNAKEEPIVYPEVDKMPQAGAMLDLLDTAVMPADWVCQHATDASAKPRSLPW